MEQTVTLKNQAPDGSSLEAIFLPEKGMNLISFKKGSIEMIDPLTRPLFKERFSGLGPLIGPHFHRRKPEILPRIENEALFPHIERIRAQGILDPFSHGIARYCPWKAKATDHEISATISGKDTWEGVPLESLEGQNFQMYFKAKLTPLGLEIDLSVVSDADSVVGIHYYYRLPKNKGEISCKVAPHCLEMGEKKPLPKIGEVNDQHTLSLSLEEVALDHTLYPFPPSTRGEIILKTEEYTLKTLYKAFSEENSFQLYHPKGASFVCIEPLSASDPRHPNLSVSALQISLHPQ